MDFPDDLPWLLEYRVGNTVRTTLPRKPVQAISSSGDTNARIVCPQIPLGASGWRRPGEEDWKPMAQVPATWLPFLQRRRPSPMDPRKEV